MITIAALRWIPNALTMTRALLGAAVAIAGSQQEWRLAFVLFIAALLTDFLDGWAAILLRAKTKFGAELDRLADGALVVAGLAGVTLGGQLAWWAAATLLLAGLLIGAEWFFWPKSGRGIALRVTTGVACLFVAWIYIAWMYATLAYGWSWGYVPLTAGILGVLAFFKRHRIKAWMTPPGA